MREMYGARWHAYDFDNKLDAILCHCGEDVQDTNHITLECKTTKEARDRLVLAITDADGITQVGESGVEGISAKAVLQHTLHCRMGEEGDVARLRLHKKYATALHRYLEEVEAEVVKHTMSTDAPMSGGM